MNRIAIVFDGPPSHESGRFVEVENEEGHSIKAGTWERRGAYHYLWLSPADLPGPRVVWTPDTTPTKAFDPAGTWGVLSADGQTIHILHGPKEDAE